MDKHFGKEADSISSRAVAVSAYLYVEDAHVSKRERLVPEFVRFFLKLLDEIRANLKLLAQYKNPENRFILEEFQKYVSQASVEPYAIKRRHLFLKSAFEYYLAPISKGKIIGRQK
jgi:hypothetical protein